MELSRSAGILLHVASLPGSMGIGDLGAGAYRFVDWLQKAGQKWWQILPIGPLTEENQPYSSQSSWAGAYEYIDLLALRKTGELTKTDLKDAVIPDGKKVLYEKMRPLKQRLLQQAAQRFFAKKSDGRYAEFEDFCKKERWWLDDWAVFSALKVVSGGKPWWKWDTKLALHDNNALKTFVRENKELVDFQKYYQFLFCSQWDKLREYAASAGIKIIGDVPIYCAKDSQDVWAALKRFSYDEAGNQLGQAGVPPDCFSETGQLWGMPVYNWSAHKAEQFSWWMDRLRGAFSKADLVRLDHFMGFERYWDVPAKNKTAKGGTWKKGPGDAFFKRVHKVFGEPPFIAEDLGLLTPEVKALRDRWNLPGMKVLQFAFDGDATNEYLPHYHKEHCVVYTGTHDNDTALGWYRSISKKTRKFFEDYVGKRVESPVRSLMRMAYSSVASLSVVPMQDVLELGSVARQNLPGGSVKGGNYRWKLVPQDLSLAKAKELKQMMITYHR
ncbi:MAG: 4-alpha-glucanotransferase [Bdellovibrionota bacterium]|jgi:4-alpha-glucanotransferase